MNARTFPLYRQKVLTRFFAAMPIRSHLGGQHFDPETIRLMGIAFEMALVSLQRTDGSINPTLAPRGNSMGQMGQRVRHG